MYWNPVIKKEWTLYHKTLVEAFDGHNSIIKDANKTFSASANI